MNALLWVFQIALALLYLSGGAYKAFSFDQVASQLTALSRSGWRAIGFFEMLGAVLLIVGVFAMLYVKERRLWLWLEAAPGRSEQTRVRMALSSNRDSPDLPVEFQALKQRLLHEEA